MLELAYDLDETRKRLDEAEKLLGAFVARVDAGEIRSKKTYASFKDFIARKNSGSKVA